MQKDVNQMFAMESRLFYIKPWDFRLAFSRQLYDRQMSYQCLSHVSLGSDFNISLANTRSKQT